MPLVDAKCPNCGGSLKINDDKKAAICPYCKEAYIVQDAINNYSYVTNNTIHNTTNIENLNANVIQLNDDRTVTARLEAAETFLHLREYDQAEDAFQEVCRLTPQDYRGWWGIVRVLTAEFSVPFPSGRREDLKKNIDRALLFADPVLSLKMRETLNEYSSFLKSKSERDKIALEEYARKIKEESLQMQKRYEAGIVVADGEEIVSQIPSEYQKIITKAIIPNSVKRIADYAFSHCSNLVEIYIPDSVTEIGCFAFEDCENLKSISLSKNLLRLGQGAFKSCYKLEEIILPGSLKRLVRVSDEMFKDISSRGIINMFSENNHDVNPIFDNCHALHKVVFSDGIQAVDATIFFGCPERRTIRFPDCEFINYYETPGRNWIPGRLNSELYNTVTTIIASPQWKKMHKKDFKCLNKGCYIATSVYGSYDCPEVWALRRYRDRFLAERWYGRAFIKLYYAISPTMVKLFGQTKWFNGFFRKIIDKYVAALKLRGFEDAPYYDK